MGAVIPLAFLLMFTILLAFIFFAFALEEHGEKGIERRGKICLFFVLACFLACLRPFGLFSILPANKSFKQFKRYMLLKNLKTNYKLNSQKGG